jgi:hypothetical protein
MTEGKIVTWLKNVGDKVGFAAAVVTRRGGGRARGWQGTHIGPQLLLLGVAVGPIGSPASCIRGWAAQVHSIARADAAGAAVAVSFLTPTPTPQVAKGEPIVVVESDKAGKSA